MPKMIKLKVRENRSLMRAWLNISGLLLFVTVGASIQRMRVRIIAEPTPAKVNIDKKLLRFNSFFSPARRITKAVLRIINSGPIATQFMSSKLIVNSILKSLHYQFLSKLNPVELGGVL